MCVNYWDTALQAGTLIIKNAIRVLYNSPLVITCNKNMLIIVVVNSTVLNTVVLASFPGLPLPLLPASPL